MAYATVQISSGAGLGIGLTAGETITAGLLLKVATADGTLYKATATSEDLVGVSLSGGAAGDSISIGVAGDVVLCLAGDTVTRGTAQMFSTGAKIKDATGNVCVIGTALASGVSGDLIPVLVGPGRTGTA